MAKIDIAGWQADQNRRATRVAAGLCPMCGNPKRDADQFDSDECAKSFQLGLASK